MDSDHSPATPVERRLLQLGPGGDRLAAAIQANLSALAGRDRHLWLGGDEGRSLLRLQQLDDHLFGCPSRVKLSDYGLAAGKEEGESDLEGLALDRQRLWMVGSHSLRRLKADSAKGPPLSVPLESRRNAHLLACLHLDANGQPLLGQRLRPSRRASRDLLSKTLAADPLIAPFASIPGKDNGLDIEGIVARDERLLLGLRGPLLRGVALVVDLLLADLLLPGDPSLASGTSVGPDLRLSAHRLRYLDLDGLAVRDMVLLPDSDDLLLLAGPTMTLAGPSYLYRWRAALSSPTASGDSAAFTLESPERLICLRDGHPASQGDGSDKPEGLYVECSGDRHLVWVAYDDPSGARRQGDGICTRLDGYLLP